MKATLGFDFKHFWGNLQFPNKVNYTKTFKYSYNTDEKRPDSKN